MTSNLLLRLSQSGLNTLATCPRRFQHTYLEQLKTPIELEQQERSTWGSQFHLLMQQRELGLPINTFSTDDPTTLELQESVNALMNTAPHLFVTNPQTWREAEHCRTLRFGQYLLTVVYDLLITTPENATILDWKTYLIPENHKKIARNWQTRLYLYLLAETSEYAPEQIAMTYWFVKLPSTPQSLTLKYSQGQHEQTQQDLEELLLCLDDWLAAYFDRGQLFPQVSPTKGYCQYCAFASRCKRTSETEVASYSVTEIEEVAI
jgi:hypothetical protein